MEKETQIPQLLEYAVSDCSLLDYKSKVKILLDNDFLAYRKDTLDIDCTYKGDYLEYKDGMSEKEWALKNLELKAPFSFGLLFVFDVETDKDGNNKKTIGNFESEYGKEVSEALEIFGWTDSDLENLEITDDGCKSEGSIFHKCYVEMIIEVDYCVAE
jgi:hypothetical protein